MLLGVLSLAMVSAVLAAGGTPAIKNFPDADDGLTEKDRLSAEQRWIEGRRVDIEQTNLRQDLQRVTDLLRQSPNDIDLRQGRAEIDDRAASGFYRETKRTRDYIEMFSFKRGLWVRVYSDKAEWSFDQTQWGLVGAGEGTTKPKK